MQIQRPILFDQEEFIQPYRSYYNYFVTIGQLVIVDSQYYWKFTEKNGEFATFETLELAIKFIKKKKYKNVLRKVREQSKSHTLNQNKGLIYYEFEEEDLCKS